MHDRHSLFPFEEARKRGSEEAKREMRGECSSRTLYLRSEKKRMTVITINKGEIINALYGIVRGV